MFALLSPRLWIAAALVAALAFSHFAAFRKGKANVRLEWTASVAAANEEARRMEQARQSRVDEAGRAAATRETRLRADIAGAARERDGLRGDLDAIQRASADSIAAANNAVRTLGDVLEQCSREYLSVAEAADRATSEVKQLREAWPQ